MRIEVDCGYNPAVESMADGCDTRYYCTSDEDWALARLYLTDAEIAEYGLVPTNYNGGDCDWITLPKRDDDARTGEHLVAAYGGMLTDICTIKGFANSTDATGAYWAEPGWEESRYAGDAEYLPKALRDAVYGAIRDKYGTYGDLECPYLDRELGWIEHPDYTTALAEEDE